jgi:hypothetical protein
MRLIALLGVLALTIGLCGCGSSNSGSPTLSVAPASTFKLAHFTPGGAMSAGKATTVSFQIDTPDGGALTRFLTGPGPHTGVHLIIVRDDLGLIIHRHPPIAADGRISQSVVFPTAGQYRVLVDVYPKLSGQQLRNFQLYRSITVSGAAHPIALPPFKRNVTVDGYHFHMDSTPHIKSVQPVILVVHVTDKAGHVVKFTPWYGALGHAIFFRQGSLNYFHTHICAPGLVGCTSTLGGPPTTVQPPPGVLRVGVLVPDSGTWRLFLQCQVDGHILTAPYTLEVS